MYVGSRRTLRGVRLVVVTAASSALLSVAPHPASAEQVECTGSVTAGSYRHLVVPEGATCVLQRSVVTGNVRVLPGGTFVAEASAIGGAIVGHDVNRIMVGRSTIGRNIVVHGGQPVSPPPVAVSVCGTSIAGNVIVQQVTGGIGLRTYIPGFDSPVGIGARCGSVRNEIGGNLIVSNNVSFRALVQNNVVHGNMLVVQNAGPGPKTFTGNQVAGTIVCIDNDEPFTASGNQAASTSGQCH